MCKAVQASPILVLLLLTAVLGPAAADGEASKIPHGTVDLVSSLKSIKPDLAFQAGLLFRLELGWHVYWKNPGDSGLPPRLKWELPEGFAAGEIEWPTPKRLPIGQLLDYGYEGEVLLPLTVKASAAVPVNSKQELKANLRVLVCRETCIPGKAALALTLPVRRTAPEPVTEYSALFEQAKAAQPKPLPADWKVTASQTRRAIDISIGGVPDDTNLWFIPGAPNVIENAARQEIASGADGVRVKLKKAADSVGDLQALDGLLITEQAGKTAAYTLATPVTPAPRGTFKLAHDVSPPAQSLLTILALAFGGGLILNLMPCVFPVLSIKVLSLLDHSQGERKTVQLSAAIYTAGVLVSFWILVAVLLALRTAGRSLGWGFQLQAPGFVAFLICLLFVLGLSLIGAFEIGTSLMSTGSGLTQRGRYSSSFFTGVLATVVATPCTAPLMGAAVGFALGQSPAVSVLVFTVMAIGLASPFLLLSVFPGLTRYLPRPGAWMETLKQLMAFPVFATVIWLLWVLGQQVGVNQLAGLLLTLLVLAIAGWIAGRWPQSRTAKAVAIVLGLAVTIFSTASVAPLAAGARASSNQSGPRAANELRWEPFTAEKLAGYRAAGKPVLVDYTAAWCLTCQVNDRVVFHSPEVQRHLNNSNIALLRADWTSYDPAITASLAEFGRSGIPFYVVYGAKENATPVTLPDGLLTPTSFLENLRKADL
jgi:thiol:disulfide interchange protein